jgi:hypothetical protein
MISAHSRAENVSVAAQNASTRARIEDRLLSSENQAWEGRMIARFVSVTIAFGCSWLLAANSYAGTNSFSRTVTSGQPKRIAAYHSWDPHSCNSLAATMNILVKPAHGVLIPRVIPWTITTSRFGPVMNCAGKPIKALQIEYKSTPGYRGTDTFTIDVTFGWEGRRDTDTYTVTVQ